MGKWALVGIVIMSILMQAFYYKYTHLSKFFLAPFLMQADYIIERPLLKVKDRYFH